MIPTHTLAVVGNLLIAAVPFETGDIAAAFAEAEAEARTDLWGATFEDVVVFGCDEDVPAGARVVYRGPALGALIPGAVVAVAAASLAG